MAPFDVEVHEFPDGTPVEEISMHFAINPPSLHTPVERHGHTLHDWALASLKMLGTKEGVLQTTLPTPMMAAEIVPVLERIAKSPLYGAQTINLVSADHKPVQLVAGKVVLAEQT